MEVRKIIYCISQLYIVLHNLLVKQQELFYIKVGGIRVGYCF